MHKIVRFAILVGTLFAAPLAWAVEGEPVAIVRQADGSILIETMWNLYAEVSKASADDDLSARAPSAPCAGVRLIRVAAIPEPPGAWQPGHFVAYVSKDGTIDRTLDRLANRLDANWKAASAKSVVKPSANAMHVQSVQNAIIVRADGVKVGHVVDAELSAAVFSAIKDCDVLIYDGDPAGNRQLIKIAKKAGARVLVLESPANVDAAENLSTNTITLTNKKEADASLRVVALAKQPTKLSDELADLFERKETACRNSQKVFADLSTAQMNFKPGNGSHTPRWNTEHMMGRELLFFSQIFHAIDDLIPVMDLNPKQMPPDYRAKHADWTGDEEARQMQRVSAFTRRYAHLLVGLPLDKKAPGSFWTPRKLLLQMERHYSEHTANVQKKFKLPDWPKN